jgi:pantoate--beta-alanine ligase
LESVGCDLAFLPSREEIYGRQHDPKYLHDFGHLEHAFEGAYRPGHFRGVGQVVHLLFEAVHPMVAFFGEKDFQQLQVIRALVKKMEANIEIVGLPTIREADGLAMSSRNRRLNEVQREQSVALYRSLVLAKERFGQQGVAQIKAEVDGLFEAASELRLEYFDIIDPERFEPVESKETCSHPHAVIAAYAGEVRLIDNMALA